MGRIVSIFMVILFLSVCQVHAEEVQLQQDDLTLNASLEKAHGWPVTPTILITHGTLD